MKLEAGQVAVITGAANGIGEALARELSGRGLRVVLADLEDERLAEVVDGLDGEAVAVPTDVADADQVQRLADTALDRFGAVDLLFNNAGMGVGGPIWQVSAEQWQRVQAVNVGGVVNGIRSFVPAMVAAGRGHVVNTASVAGITAGAFNAPYIVSKHGVVALSESLQAELSIVAPGVGVTVVCPGPVDTRLLRGLLDAVEGLTPERLRGVPGAEWMAEFTPEQWERFRPGVEMLAAMKEDVVSAARAAEMILTAVESDRLYVTTHPGYAVAARDRVERMITDLEASA
ncbi:SDR family NAD(P)-dependent oxidoreductase [Nocardia sp. CDC159]|uniref:SDR family NAD(P)-dependent oxidoreductase n=1 Tax=Nocardia pulmonis TaxID=2951408 RepID=A0A9X2EBZ7_9NOCA|nr:MULTISPECIES: SDR family NAD(P)-dependent oxidoreductase [Nocardia]MCM6777515.1 SDR family NAD(P)-dependent oxidoreductase [Nocardia pulmonis]MCM6790378.1 SDR family NAD(P)-dependent oxidoreductase [Nocardia sp. CDC159]